MLKARGLTVFLTTHYLEETNQLCDRIGILHQGRLVALAQLAVWLVLFGHLFAAADIVQGRPYRAFMAATCSPTGVRVTLSVAAQRSH
ncbi:MAG: hypothetical protein KGZ35_04995 [Truepera sp.]|nr:hypothetical protein [Truepera sp.]